MITETSQNLENLIQTLQLSSMGTVSQFLTQTEYPNNKLLLSDTNQSLKFFKLKAEGDSVVSSSTTVVFIKVLFFAISNRYSNSSYREFKEGLSLIRKTRKSGNMAYFNLTGTQKLDSVIHLSPTSPFLDRQTIDRTYRHTLGQRRKYPSLSLKLTSFSAVGSFFVKFSPCEGKHNHSHILTHILLTILHQKEELLLSQCP